MKERFRVPVLLLAGLILSCGPGQHFCQLELELKGYKKGDATVKILKDSEEAARPQNNLFSPKLKFQVDCAKYNSPLQVAVTSSRGVQVKEASCDCNKKATLSFQEKK